MNRLKRPAQFFACLSGCRSSRTEPGRARIWAAVTAVVLNFAGCVTPTREAIESLPTRPARIELVNVCASDWAITLTPDDGRATRVVHVPAWETVGVELGAGPYSIDQAALTRLEGPDSHQRFAMEFQAGEKYRWKLTTLLTTTARASP